MSAETSGDVTHIQDEDILRRMWQDTEDFSKKKEIRSHMYKLREERLRNFYCSNEPGDIHKAQSTPGLNEKSGKDGNTLTHADSLGDHSFLSLKSKEIRDSESPTRDVNYRISDKNYINPSWNVVSKSETSNDGKTHSTSRIATTSGTDEVKGGVANYSAECEQMASVFADGDDTNFTKSAAASSKKTLQQNARTKDGNSETQSFSTSTNSSSQVVTHKQSTDFQNLPAESETSNSNTVVRKSYTSNIPAEFKNHPHYIDGKTKVTTETRVMPDGTKVTTTKYETRGVDVASSEQHRTSKQQTFSTTTSSSKNDEQRLNSSDHYRSTTERSTPKDSSNVATLKVFKLSNDNGTQDTKQQVTTTTSSTTEIQENRQVLDSKSSDFKVSTDQTQTHDDVKNIRVIHEKEYIPRSAERPHGPKPTRITTREQEYAPQSNQQSHASSSSTTVIQRGHVTDGTTTTRNYNDYVQEDHSVPNVSNRQYNTEKVITTTTATHNIKGATERDTLESDIPTQKDVRKEQPHPGFFKDVHDVKEEVLESINKYESTTGGRYPEEPKPANRTQPSHQKHVSPEAPTIPREVKPAGDVPDRYKTITTTVVTKTTDELDRPITSGTKPQEVIRHETVSEINSKQHQTTYKADYTSKRISVEVSPTHDAFARSLRAISPDRDQRRQSNTSLRRSATPDKHPIETKSLPIKDKPTNRKISPTVDYGVSPRSSPSRTDTRPDEVLKDVTPTKRTQPRKSVQGADYTNEVSTDFYNIQTRESSHTTNRHSLNSVRSQSPTLTASPKKPLLESHGYVEKRTKNIVPEQRPTSLNVTSTITSKKNKKITDRSPTSPLTPTKDKPQDKPLKRRDTYEERCRQILGIDHTTEERTISKTQNEKGKRPNEPGDRSPTKQKPFVEVSVERPLTKPIYKDNETDQSVQRNIQEYPSQIRRSQEKYPGKNDTPNEYINPPQDTIRPDRNRTQISEFPSQIRRSPEKHPSKQSPNKSTICRQASPPKQRSEISEPDTKRPQTPKYSTQKQYSNGSPRQPSPTKTRPEILEYPAQNRQPQERSPPPKETSPFKDRPFSAKDSLEGVPAAKPTSPKKEVPSTKSLPLHPKSTGILEHPSQIRSSPEKYPEPRQTSPDKSCKTRNAPENRSNVKKPSRIGEPPSKIKNSSPIRDIPPESVEKRKPPSQTIRPLDKSVKSVVPQDVSVADDDDNHSEIIDTAFDFYAEQIQRTDIHTGKTYTSQVTNGIFPVQTPEPQYETGVTIANVTETRKPKEPIESGRQPQNYLQENLDTKIRTDEDYIRNTNLSVTTETVLPTHPPEIQVCPIPSRRSPEKYFNKDSRHPYETKPAIVVPEEIITITEELITRKNTSKLKGEPDTQLYHGREPNYEGTKDAFDFYETQTQKDATTSNVEIRQVIENENVSKRPKAPSEVTLATEYGTSLKSPEQPGSKHYPPELRYLPDKNPSTTVTDQRKLFENKITTKQSLEHETTTDVLTRKKQIQPLSSQDYQIETVSRETFINKGTSEPDLSDHPDDENQDGRPRNQFGAVVISKQIRTSVTGTGISQKQEITLDGRKPQSPRTSPTRRVPDSNKGTKLQEYPSQLRGSPDTSPIRRVPNKPFGTETKPQRETLCQKSPIIKVPENNKPLTDRPKSQEYQSKIEVRHSPSRKVPETASQPKDRPKIQEYPSQVGRSPNTSPTRQVHKTSVQMETTYKPSETLEDSCAIKKFQEKPSPVKNKPRDEPSKTKPALNKNTVPTRPETISRSVDNGLPTSVTVKTESTVTTTKSVGKLTDHKYRTQTTVPSSKSSPTRKLPSDVTSSVTDSQTLKETVQTKKYQPNLQNKVSDVRKRFPQDNSPDINEPVCTKKLISTLCREDVQRNATNETHRTVKKDSPEKTTSMTFINNERNDTNVSLTDLAAEKIEDELADLERGTKPLGEPNRGTLVDDRIYKHETVINQEEIRKGEYDFYKENHSPPRIPAPCTTTITTSIVQVEPARKIPVTKKYPETITKSTPSPIQLKPLQNKKEPLDKTSRFVEHTKTEISTTKRNVDKNTTHHQICDTKLGVTPSFQLPQKGNKTTRQYGTSITTTTYTSPKTPKSDAIPISSKPYVHINHNDRQNRQYTSKKEEVPTKPVQRSTEPTNTSPKKYDTTKSTLVVLKTEKPEIKIEAPLKERKHGEYNAKKTTYRTEVYSTTGRKVKGPSPTKTQELPQTVNYENRKTPTRTIKPQSNIPEHLRGKDKSEETQKRILKTIVDFPSNALKSKDQPSDNKKHTVTGVVCVVSNRTTKLDKQPLQISDTREDTTDDTEIYEESVDRTAQRVVTTKSILINNDIDENTDVIVTLRRSTSSREPTPNRVCPQPTSDEEDNGTPRYPDEITEPNESSRKPFYIHGPQGHYPEADDSTPGVRVDRVDETDESLLTVTQKVNKFVNEGEKRTKTTVHSANNQRFIQRPHDSKPIQTLKTQEVPQRPKSPRCENYPKVAPDQPYTSVSERVSQFIKTVESVKSPQKPNTKVFIPDTGKPQFEEGIEEVTKYTTVKKINEVDKPVSLAKLDINPKEYTDQYFESKARPTDLPDCPQIETEEETYIRNTSPLRNSPTRRLQNNTSSRNKHFDRKSPEPESTPKSSRTDHVQRQIISPTGMLRSTETIQKAKKLFETTSSVQNSDKQTPSRITETVVKRLSYPKYESEETVTLNKVVKLTEEQPDYMKSLNRSPRPQFSSPSPRPSVEKLIPDSPDRTQSTEPDDAALEGIPHYMWPLNRTSRDHSVEHDHSPSRSVSETPDIPNRRTSRGSTPDKYVPGYMRPLERHVSPNSQPKPISTFGVTLKTTQHPKSSNTPQENELDVNELLSRPDFDNIYSIEILELLLERAVNYEQRRKIRAQIRIVKQNVSDSDRAPSKVVTRTAYAKPDRVTRITDNVQKVDQESFHNKNTVHVDRKTEYQESYQSTKRHTTTEKLKQKTNDVRHQNTIIRQSPGVQHRNSDKPKNQRGEDDKPSWVNQRNLKKVSESRPKAPATSSITTTTSTTPMKKITSSTPKGDTPTDVITSGYGVGPTDENGSPLFGLRALRVQNQTESKKVQGTVIQSHYYSKNGQEPIGEIRVTKYSTDPGDLQGDVEDKDGIVSVTTIQKVGPKESSRKQIMDTKQITDISDEEFEAFGKKTTTTLVRRDSVKEMSKKFIENAVETSKTERQSSYPKAGLILRTSSFKETGKQDTNKETSLEDQDAVSTVTVTKTVTSSGGGSRVDTFLTNKTRVTGVQDTIKQMKNAEEDVQIGDSTEDIEARTLLNKFIGSQVILSGMESRSSSSIPGASNFKRATTTTTTTARSTGSEKPTVITRTFTHPITAEDLSTVWDEETLKLLLERSTEYEERRVIRLRLRDIMAEQEVCANVVQQASQDTSGRVEEVETSRTTVTEGPVTTNKVTTKVTSQQVTKKPLSPFAKFQQLDKQNSLGSPGTPRTPTGSGPLFKFTDPELSRQASTVKERLLQWCQMKTKEYENVQLDNFSSSWSDGLGFCALIHHFLPDAFDYHALTPKERRHNFDLAFRIADEKADIAPLLDVEDMIATRKPDWKCVFTYVQTIYARFKNED